jgi:uncharacterized membrane protein YsdA (DUF1294 family)
MRDRVGALPDVQGVRVTSSFVVLVMILVGLNVFTFLVFACDKACAKRGAWRVPEQQLLLLMTLGGSIGGWVAILTLHHKNRKLSFRLVASTIVCLQLVAMMLLQRWWFGAAVLP